MQSNRDTYNYNYYLECEEKYTAVQKKVEECMSQREFTFSTEEELVEYLVLADYVYRFKFDHIKQLKAGI